MITTKAEIGRFANSGPYIDARCYKGKEEYHINLEFPFSCKTATLNETEARALYDFLGKALGENK